ncbi:MAG: hypothetical protein PVG39_02400 [Desulfobacteraceae bacterium]
MAGPVCEPGQPKERKNMITYNYQCRSCKYYNAGNTDNVNYCDYDSPEMEMIEGKLTCLSYKQKGMLVLNEEPGTDCRICKYYSGDDTDCGPAPCILESPNPIIAMDNQGHLKCFSFERENSILAWANNLLDKE